MTATVYPAELLLEEITLAMAYMELIPAEPVELGSWTILANYEGWDIVENIGSDIQPALGLQWSVYPDEFLDCDLPDTPYPTAGDGTVARVVAARALEGSVFHLRVLRGLYWACNQEWRRIVALHHYDTEYDDELPPVAVAYIAEGRRLDGIEEED